MDAKNHLEHRATARLRTTLLSAPTTRASNTAPMGIDDIEVVANVLIKVAPPAPSPLIVSKKGLSQDHFFSSLVFINTKDFGAC